MTPATQSRKPPTFREYRCEKCGYRHLSPVVCRLCGTFTAAYAALREAGRA